MNTYSSLLRTAASEIRAFAQTTDARSFSSEWLAKLATRFDRASDMSDSVIGLEIETLAHFLADSGPTASESAPSFGVVMDAYQRAKKRMGKR